MKINYDCEELIDELKKDIEEFGDIDMYAFFEEVDGIVFLTNYDFILSEKNPRDSVFPPNIIKKAILVIMKASDILDILEEQARF